MSTKALKLRSAKETTLHPSGFAGSSRKLSAGKPSVSLWISTNSLAKTSSDVSSSSSLPIASCLVHDFHVNKKNPSFLTKE